ncbi:MAG: hypothetical protein CVU15_05015 [Betaproteobacteria bacterium HGW-Betaproteobacteria-1]|jgi:CDP-4-dehydro-6-deoxyglucose reductase|nr:MAG: hypothetical protein CVU15_05015 [Betaproteobacteria bacterium HGW-Betaproteobacteria-1]
MKSSQVPPIVTITLKISDDEEFQMTMPTGQTLMTALHSSQLIPGICGGNAACGTCRLTIDRSWIRRLPPMERAERRLITALAGKNSSDRLACQIKLEPWMEGLVVRLPGKSF